MTQTSMAQPALTILGGAWLGDELIAAADSQSVRRLAGGLVAAENLDVLRPGAHLLAPQRAWSLNSSLSPSHLALSVKQDIQVTAVFYASLHGTAAWSLTRFVALRNR